MAGILTSISVMLNYAVFAFFILNAFRGRLRFSLKFSAGLVSLLGIYSGFASYYYCSRHLTLSTSWAVIVWFVCAAVFIKLIIKNGFLQLLYLLLVCVNIFNNIMLLSNTTALFLALPADKHIRILLINVALLILYVPFLFLLLTRLYRQIPESEIDLPFWKFAWIIPSLLYVIYMIKIIPDYLCANVTLTPSDIIFISVWNLVVYLIFYIIFYMTVQTNKSFIAAGKIKLIERQLEVQKNLYQKLTDSFEKTARLRHDFRHHLVSIHTYVQNGNIGELQTYLSEYMAYFSEQSREEDETPLCMNYTVDIILRHYVSLAKKQGISVKTAVRIPYEACISDIDLCILFGNLAENALEACLRQTEGKRYIRILAAIKKKQLFVCVENSFNGEINEKNGVYSSSKRPGQGIGISSIMEIAARNQGYVKIEHSDCVFKVYVYLCIN